ncbi:PKD domain-containing protein [Neobacillus niacini]|uniref:PKD domain-containing protein n=1 Tax=Neobacillus niacini TaxID=86668 RepID=UPI003982FDF6
MLPSGSKRKRKKVSTLKSVFLLAITAVLIISSGIWGDGAKAEYLVPMEDIPKLQKVGPIGDYGYPVWYKDSNGKRLELCLEGSNPNCGFAVGEFPAGDLSVKNGNFPEEAFYQLASASIELPSGGDADAVFALEAAWANELVQDGDQIVFGRVRFRIDDLTVGEKYTITHPYGIDEIEATPEDDDVPNGPGEIRFVEDIGINGGFEGARTSRIGTFLEWDTTADRPPGFVGNPDVDHKIINGYFNGTEEQNYFRIQGPGINSTCVTSTGTIRNCIQTDLFSLMGKEATTAGVDAIRATYSQDSEGSGTIDVFASTEEDKQYSIDIDINDDGTKETTMEGVNGQYFGRVKYSGAVPENVTVINTTDNPDSTKVIPVVDYISATAKYDTNSKTLYVTASSSDKVNNPTLTVQGLDKIVPDSDNLDKSIPASGTLAITSPQFVPPTITIKSAENGTTTVPVEVTSDPAIANPGKAQTVKQGTLVTLDGSASMNAATYKWEQVSGPEVQLNLENPAKPTFTFPKKFIPVSFKLTVTGNDGKASTNESIVTITPAPDILKTTEVSFATSTSTLKVSGTSDVFGPGVNITILAGGKSFIAVVLSDGKWSITSRGVTSYKPGDTINIISTSGGKLTNVTVKITTR